MAVLPFRAVSSEPDDELLAEAMTDGLIAELSRAGALKVISRTSSNQYAGTRKPLPAIARELDVQAVVEGSVLRHGDDFRVAVRLIEASTDQGLWSGTFDAAFDHVLDLQRDIAVRIAREIAVSIGPPENARRARASRGNAEAVRLYLMGRRFLNSRWQPSSWLEHWEDARLAFEGALALDSTDARAYAGLAELYTFAAVHGRPLPSADAFARAEIAARRALELDDSLGEVHAALGMIRLSRDWDWDASRRAFERALRLQPNAVDTRVLYALYLRSVGRQAEAIAQRERALELDPLRVHSRNLLGTELFFARRFEDAAAQFRKSLQIDSTSAAAHAGLGACYEHLQRHDLAAAHWTLALRHGGRSDLAERFEPLLRSVGYTGARRSLDRRWLDEELGTSQPDPWIVGYTHARLGNRDAAFSWLERAYAARDAGLLQIRVDPNIDSLRSDPRYLDLVKRIGFPE